MTEPLVPARSPAEVRHPHDDLARPACRLAVRDGRDGQLAGSLDLSCLGRDHQLRRRLLARPPRPGIAQRTLGLSDPARSKRVGQAVHGHDAGAVVRLDRSDGARCPLSLVACPALCGDHRFPPPYPRLLSRVADLQGEQLRRARGQDPERARTPRDYRRTLRLCSPSDVCRGPADQHRRAASPRLVVGACWPVPCSPS